jgi:hypothetical protein
MRADYKDWLASQEYAGNTQVAQLHRVQKVEQYYGSLDAAFENGTFDSIIAELQYSAADERVGKPNPSKIQFDGNIRNNLQSYKNAALRYRTFLAQVGDASVFVQDAIDDATASRAQSESDRQKFGLERDMQAALRKNIEALEAGLQITDDGAERAVFSGFIDILCVDSGGVPTVIELKAGKTDARVVGQVLGYMGDLIHEDDAKHVRGIIVAHEFDKRTVSASRAIPNLKLFKYSIAFKFEPAR